MENARNDLFARERSVAQGEDRGRTLIELHDTSGASQEMAVTGGILL
jgi:hypothetical protein